MRIVFRCDDVREEVIEAVRKSSYDDYDELINKYGSSVFDALFILGESDYSEYFPYTEDRITNWLLEMFNDKWCDIVGDYFYAKEIVEQEEKA